MALFLQDTNLKVISRIDDAVNCSPEEYNDYLQKLDETALKLEGNPTRFLLRRVLDYKTSKNLKNEQIDFQGQGKFNVKIGSAMLEDVRAALIGIEHPEGAPIPKDVAFRKGDDGLAHRDLIALLDAYGIVQDLYAARQAVVQASSAQGRKKK